MMVFGLILGLIKFLVVVKRGFLIEGVLGGIRLGFRLLVRLLVKVYLVGLLGG